MYILNITLFPLFSNNDLYKKSIYKSFLDTGYILYPLPSQRMNHFDWKEKFGKKE